MELCATCGGIYHLAGWCANCGAAWPDAGGRPRVGELVTEVTGADPVTDPLPELDLAVLEEARQGVRALLRLAGQDPTAGSLVDTPDRVVRAFLEMTSGYEEDPAEVLSRRFGREDDGGGYDGPVVLSGVRFTSLCEHHLLPFWGWVTVAYLPGDSVVGLSKLARLVACRARRLQLQERLTAQVARDLMENLGAQGAAVVVRATHGCMACRGASQPDARLVTSEMLGKFRDDAALRSELLELSRALGDV